ncbi:MAG TPA: type IV pilus assembly protein PilM [Candidatus Hydrogenedentes bacterium]|nr:type IV pilus assembly protein PilM [Candidatus Hydrogenedentota bacterium]HNT87270.1 type IV pilus assembly protein PilM [Candidatus Hydrogenedentota bacterium]
MLFTKPKKAIGIDVGNHSVKAVMMSRAGARLCVDEASYVLVDRSVATNDATLAQANAVREAVANMPTGAALLVGALPGQTVVIRYPRLPDTPKDQLPAVIQREAGQNIPYDLSEVYLSSTVLSEIQEGDTKQLKVLLVAAKHEVVNSRVQIAQAAEIQFGVLSVDSLALADGASCCNMLRMGETVALVNVGHTSASIHFVKDGVSNFIRDVSWGARELIQAIAKDRRCTPEEAEKALQAAGRGKAAPVPQVESPPRPPSGGGSLLDPLDEELGGLGEPLGEAPRDLAPMAPEVRTRDLRDVLGASLGRMVSEIRRSFDYYEHQLYEQPVSRLILSGGVAHVPILGETLMDELDVDSVEVADPTVSGPVLGDDRAVAPLRERPAQFLVALGLAARGIADL